MWPRYVARAQQIHPFGGSRGKHRVDEHAGVEQDLPHAHRTYRVPDSDRDGGRHRRSGVETEGQETTPDPIGLVVHPLNPFRLFPPPIRHRKDSRRVGGRQAGAEDQRACVMFDVVHDLVVSGDETDDRGMLMDGSEAA